VEAHDKGIIHFHDMDYFIQKISNCCLCNLEDMLENGTVISGTLIEKPKTFSTACNIATQIIAQVASSQYGGQSISIAHLSPFVESTRQKFTKMFSNLSSEDIEKLVANDIEKGVQILQYQVITLMTTNGQAPFITIYMNLSEVPEGSGRDDLAKVIEEIIKQRIQGVKNEKGIYVTPAFPKLIYALDDYNAYEGSKYYYLTQLAAKCTAKRMVPDYISNKIERELKNGDTYTCMGCRSFLTPATDTENVANALNYDKYKGHKYYGRFNQGVVTINLPFIAGLSAGDENKFWEYFDKYTEICHKALQAKHDRLLGTVSDVAPILWRYGALARLNHGETIDKLLVNNYSTISLGYAGIYEMTKFMTGHSHTDNGIGKEFALKVMQALNDKCTKWRAEENISYSLYGTPR
jgi:ribonucleoside-triphosphate reductase